MFHRSVNILNNNSFFLFGPRGTGKTTLLKKRFPTDSAFWINLLDPRQEDRFLKNPEQLWEQLQALDSTVEWVVIDEVQKVPRILDVVHDCIENTNFRFALTGSSARKLKRGASNLLAGRAFFYDLFPLTHQELRDDFDLLDVLHWGTLPRLYSLSSQEEKGLFLDAYCHTYLREEIIAEQLVRKVTPFRRFVEVAAQSNGDVINYSRIADDVGIDSKTVRSYFEILEDTLLGFLLPAYHRSIRKQQSSNPKFYLFDCGVQRSLARTLEIPLKAGTYEYGRSFEHFVVLEMFRLNSYQRKKFRFSYLRTKDGAEIDTILDRPGKPLALVEIKSATNVAQRHLTTLQRFATDIPNSEAFCLCQEPQPRKVGNIHILPWQRGLDMLGFGGS